MNKILRAFGVHYNLNSTYLNLYMGMPMAYFTIYINVCGTLWIIAESGTSTYVEHFNSRIQSYKFREENSIFIILTHQWLGRQSVGPTSFYINWYCCFDHFKMYISYLQSTDVSIHFLERDMLTYRLLFRLH